MKKILIIAIIILVAVLAFPVSLYIAADPTDVATSMAQAVSKTGRQLAVKGKASFSMFPTPHFTFDDVVIREQQPASSLLPTAYTVAQMEVYPSVFSLFGTAEISSITLQRPVAKLRVTAKEESNWSTADIGMLKALSAYTTGSLTIENGMLESQDATNNVFINVKDIFLSMESSAEHFEISGSFVSDIGPGKISWETPSAGQAEISLSIGDVALSYDGALKNQNDSIDLDGDWKLSFPSWWDHARKEGDAPFAIEGKIKKSADVVILQDALVKGRNTEGKIVASARLGDKIPFQMRAAFSSLDIGVPWEVVDKSKKAVEPATAVATASNTPPTDWSALLKRFAGQVNLTVKELRVGEHSVRDVQAVTLVQEGEFNISQAYAVLPGEAPTILIGILRPEEKGMSLDAGIETGGKNFYALINAFLPEAKWLPEKELGAFQIKGNVFISPRENRISEMRARIGEMLITGAAQIHQNERGTRVVDMSLGTRHINFDTYMAAWDKQYSGDSMRNLDQRPDFSWLNALESRFIISSRLDDFTLFGTSGKTALVKANLETARLNLDVASGDMDDWAGNGIINLTTLRQVPEFTLSMVLKRLNLPGMLKYLPPVLVEGEKALVQTPWSQKQFNFKILEHYNGSFDIKSDEVRYSDQVTIRDFNTKGTLKDKTLSIAEVSGAIWGGGISINGSLKGGAIPEVFASYSFGAVAAAEAFPILLGYNHFSGPMSVSGNVKAAGLSPYQWASSAVGEMNVLARGIRVDGLDVPAITRAMIAAKSSADIVNLAKLGLGSGKTEINQFKGLFRVKDGSISNLTVDVESEGVKGVLSGVFSLPQWTISALLDMTLTGVTSEGPPTVGVKIVGDANDPKITLDTRGLEAYITRVNNRLLLQGGQ